MSIVSPVGPISSVLVDWPTLMKWISRVLFRAVSGDAVVVCVDDVGEAVVAAVVWGFVTPPIHPARTRRSATTSEGEDVQNALAVDTAAEVNTVVLLLLLFLVKWRVKLLLHGSYDWR